MTGFGLVTPLGRSVSEVWEGWRTGRPVFGPITRFDARSLPVQYAAEINDFDPRQEIKNRRLLRLLVPQCGEGFGFVAAEQALESAKLKSGDWVPERAGIAVGCRKEGPRLSNFHDAIELSLDAEGNIDRRVFIEEGTPRIPPQSIVEGLPNALLYYIAHEYLLQATNHNFMSLGTGACTAAGAALQDLRNDDAELMLVGGHDSWIDWTGISHNVFSGIVSASSEDINTLYCPYDVRRSGGVSGEGATYAVIEQLAFARAREANMLGEMLGYSAGTGVPATDREACAEALAACISRALADAETEPDQIDLLFLHGAATPLGDWAEVHGLLAVLGDHARQIPATTVKSATGLMGNGSSLTELALALESLRRGEVLPIRNLQEPDPALPLDFVCEPRSGLKLRRALVLQQSWPSHFTAIVVGTAP